MVKSLLTAPCLLCGYKGVGYWQPGTHEQDCPWYGVGGDAERAGSLRDVIRTKLTTLERQIAAARREREVMEGVVDAARFLAAEPPRSDPRPSRDALRDALAYLDRARSPEEAEEESGGE